MKQPVSNMLRSYRLRREHRLLAKAMERSAPPVPPGGLRERLIEQAMAAGSEAAPRRGHSRTWLLWAVPSTALTAIVIWIAWSSTVPGAHTPVRPGVPMVRVPSTPHVAVRPEEHEAPVAAQPVHRHEIAPAPTLTRHYRSPEPVRAVRTAAQVTVAVHDPEVTSDAPVMRVTVSHARDGHIGYAQAATWTTDDTGHELRTQLTTVSDRQGRVSRQELSTTDNSGTQQSLTVAVVSPDKNQPKGEPL